MTRLRVGYVTTYPPTPCGVAEYTGDLVRSIKNLGDLSVAVFADGLTDHRAGFREVVVESAFFPGRSNYTKLLSEIKKYSPLDIIHVQHEYGLFPPSNNFIKLLESLKKYTNALVITLHTVYHTLKGGELVKHQVSICTVADAVIVHSPIMEYELWAQGVSLSKVHLIPHGTRINRSSVKRETVLERLGVGHLRDKFIFAVIGFIRKDKGLDVLLKAFKKVASMRSNVALLIAGTPQGSEGIKHAKEIHKLARDLGPATERIAEIGRYLTRRELSELIKAADVVVLPYRDEPGVLGVSGMLHTVMGCFKPVICCRTPRLSECTALVPEASVVPDDPDDLAEKMLYAVDNYKEFADFFKHLFELAVRTSWRNVARRHLMLYEKVLHTDAGKD